MWIVISIGLLLALTPFVLGLLMTPYQQVTRVELIKAPAEAVWEALSDLSQHALWRTDLASMQMLDDDDGLRWVEKTASGQATVLRKLKEAPLKELLLDMQRSGSKGSRQMRFSAVPGGTRVTFTEMLETRTAFGRIKVRIDGNPDKRLDHFILQLKTHFTTV